MNKQTRLNIFISGLTLLATMSAFLVYSNYDKEINLFGITLKKNKDLNFQNTAKKVTTQKILPKKRTDSLKIDTVPKRFILIGDSEIEGLRDPFYDYCKKNGHELALAFTWYSSTDMGFASNDTIEHLIKKYKPTHIVIVIGLNQIYQSSFEVSDKSVDKIIETFNGIPYSWIGPANWTEDKGINEFYQKKIDSGCFYLSKNLVLERAKDGRHPSYKGNFIWMDSIARWMQSSSKWRIRMNKPDSVEKVRNINMISLAPGKEKEKQKENENKK